MSAWPSWRFVRKQESLQTERNLKQIAVAKEEAEAAVEVAREQVKQIHKITEAHKPIRKQMKRLRENNHFADGFRRVIGEGR
jgi:PP-loop superfamily ATP-utilizing enzyme